MRFVGSVLVLSALLIIGISRISPSAQGAAAQSPGPISQASPAVGTYTPQTKNFVVTTVPLLVHEETGTLSYLKKDFSSHGLLAGKEIWGFSPSSLTVYQGDTVDLTLVDPSGDPHTFTVPDLGFNLNVKAEASASGSFTATKVGVFTYSCVVAEHSPYMWGQLIVLPDSVAPQS